MREELNDDKVFDVIGQTVQSNLFWTALITRAITENQAGLPPYRLLTHDARWKIYKVTLKDNRKSVISKRGQRITPAMFSTSGNPAENASHATRLCPKFFWKDAAPLLGYRINGDIETVF